MSSFWETGWNTFHACLGIWGTALCANLLCMGTGHMYTKQEKSKWAACGIEHPSFFYKPHLFDMGDAQHSQLKLCIFMNPKIDLANAG